MAPVETNEPEATHEDEDAVNEVMAVSALPKSVRDYFEGSGMSLHDYFQFPEMQNIRNPVHEYFRLRSDTVACEGASDWLLEGILLIEEGEDGWVILGAEHQELARIAVGRSGDRNYYAYAWDGSYIGPLLRTTSSALHLSARVVLGTASVAGMALSCGVSALRGAPLPYVPPSDAHLNDRFVEESVEVGGHTWFFRVWLPPDMESLRAEHGGRLPALLMLHGFKECGWDNWWQTNSGFALCLRENWKWASWFPGIVVLPQLPRRPHDERWWEHWRAPAMQQMALACLEQAVSKYTLDRQRLYLLGESLGTEGAWFLAASKPNYFAAVGGSCGSVEPYDWLEWDWGSKPELYEQLAQDIGRELPIWFCHGGKDDFVPVAQSRRFSEALCASRQGSAMGDVLRRRPAAAEVVFREYEELDHHVWDHAYGEDGLIEWMLAQRAMI